MPSPGLVTRASRARRSLEKLRWIASIPWERYSSDEDLQALAERYLHILLESILDTAAFIAARKGLSREPTYRDVMEAITSTEIISNELRDVALAIPGLRNVLVHCYADVRHDLIHRLLREELDKLASIFETL